MYFVLHFFVFCIAYFAGNGIEIKIYNKEFLLIFIIR